MNKPKTRPDLNSVPDRDFWARDLLRSSYRRLADLKDDSNGLDQAIQDRFRRRAAVEFIAECAGIKAEGTIADIQEALLEKPLPMIHFLLVDDFAQYKMSAAVADIAEVYLSEDDLAASQRRNGQYDRQMLLMRLYTEEPEVLRYIQGLNNWHRKGSAPMVLQEEVKKATEDIRDFLCKEKIDPILKSIRTSWTDQGTRPHLLFEMVVPRKDDGYLLFLRRALRPAYVWNEDGTDVHHGQQDEWIILHFRDGGKALKISSVTSKVPHEIANRIAGAYFKKGVTYIDDHKATAEAAIENFINAIMDPEDKRLPILEIVVENSPLTGSHKIMITNDGDRDIIDGVDHFEEAVGEILNDLDNIARIKVAFGEKKKNRISLFFPKKDGVRVVQYNDGQLDNNKCRKFEQFMEKEFKITVRSTENKGE